MMCRERIFVIDLKIAGQKLLDLYKLNQ